jgi:ribosome biogenesis GTPase
VIAYRSGFYTVQTDHEKVICTLRGRLKHGPQKCDLVALGDRVAFSRSEDGTGVIEEIVPRQSALARLAPTARGEYQQVLLANPDQIALVFACAQPQPHLRMLDRFLVICEKQKILPLIVANKVDLVGLDCAQKLFAIYPALGYPVLFTSTKTGLGLEEFRKRLEGKLSGLAGPSGVGKTSLLNAIQPGLALEAREISQSNTKGRHATVVRHIFALDSGGYVADLPGLRSLALWDTQPEELDGYFPELRPLVAACQFNDCSHAREPGCAVRAAAEKGEIHPDRYESYLRLRFGDE